MDATSSPVIEAERRSWSYWTIDGIPNLVFGLACLCETLFLVLADKSAWFELIGLIFFAAWIATLILNKRIVEWLKARTTYPRTGYAASPPSNMVPDMRPTKLLAGAEAAPALELAKMRRNRTIRQWLYVVIILPVMVLPYRTQAPWICPVAMAALGFVWWLIERDFHQTHSWVLIFGMPFVGAYMALFRVSRYDRMIALLAGLSILLILDGAFRLIRYLRGNPMVRA